MRIISGKLRGRNIKSSNCDTRPAMGKLRESLFSMLCSRGLDFADLRVLDIFAGTGSLGFEAASRGAAIIDFVDNSPELCKLLHKNAQAFEIAGQCRIHCQDARKFLSQKALQPYGLVFVDPPYRKNLTQGSLERLAANGYCRPGSYVCAEVERDAAVAVPAGFEHLAARNFGQTVLNIWMFP